MALAKNASKTGEPVVRCMEYEFPNQGFETVTDQFMLGDTILVAPIMEKGVTSRTVKLPVGDWQDCNGTVYQGGKTVEISAPLGVVPVFKKKM
jgi:alpha-glucosidase (family GH31 glycosyl hydrolase)